MKTMKRFKVLMCVAALVMGLMLLTAVVVFADGGSIELNGAADVVWTPDEAFVFQAKTLAGEAFSSTDDDGTSCIWGLVDGRGSGDGWKISISSSHLTGLTNKASEAVTSTLTAGTSPAYNQFGLQVQIVSADVIIMTGAEGSMPVTGDTALTYNVSTATDVTDSSQAVLTSPTDRGMGGYDIDPLFTIYLPAGVYAGTANLTLTVTQADSPA